MRLKFRDVKETRERLELVKKTALETSDEEWDMGVWAKEHPCKFVGCAIGNTIHQNPEIELKLELTRTYEDGRSDFDLIRYGNRNSFDAVSEWLGLSVRGHEIVTLLFDPINYYVADISSDDNTEAWKDYLDSYGETYYLGVKGDTSLFKDLPTQANVAKRIQLFIDKNLKA